MNNTIRIFDNNGKTWDRYTVVIYEDDNPASMHYASVFGMSTNAGSPSGFNQYAGSVAQNPLVEDALIGDKTALGREVDILDVPEEVKIAIGRRLEE